MTSVFPKIDADNLARNIFQIFWAGVTLDTGIGCENCGTADFVVLFDEANDRFVLSCDLCTYSVDTDGLPWDGPNPLVPPTSKTLERLVLPPRD